MLGSKVWPISSSNSTSSNHQCNASCWRLQETCTLAWFGRFCVQFLPILAPGSSGKAFFYSTAPFYMAHYSSLQLHLQSFANSNYCLNCIYGEQKKKKKVIFFECRITCWLFSYRFESQKNLEGKKKKKESPNLALSNCLCLVSVDGVESGARSISAIKTKTHSSDGN